MAVALFGATIKLWRDYESRQAALAMLAGMFAALLGLAALFLYVPNPEAAWRNNAGFSKDWPCFDLGRVDGQVCGRDLQTDNGKSTNR